MSSSDQDQVYAADSLKNTPALASSRLQPTTDLSGMRNSKQMQALLSSKIMTALHKKCNSISTTPVGGATRQAIKFQGIQRKDSSEEDSKTLLIDTLIEETFDGPPSTVRHNHHQSLTAS